ncbi:MAG: hypothetical protein QOG91_233 [Candidatus Parcubacteria bacterium]|nr:hypothetical protein [Candidatus Parcubacteria bacterium]
MQLTYYLLTLKLLIHVLDFGGRLLYSHERSKTWFHNERKFYDT